MNEGQISEVVATERARQKSLIAQGKIQYPCESPYVPNYTKLGILIEEVGEVAKALNDNEPDINLRTELVQVMAVCHAWLENL